MGHRGLNLRVSRRIECVQEWCPLLPNALSLVLRFSRKPHSRIGSESALSLTARLASNLELFGRGLAAIGTLFVFHRLPSFEPRTPTFLAPPNMNQTLL